MGWFAEDNSEMADEGEAKSSVLEKHSSPHPIIHQPPTN